MAPARPMLDDVELQQVQNIDIAERQSLAQHAVPALEGDFLQRLDRRATGFSLTGVLSGATARDDLEQLRTRFRAGQPVAFVADIASAVSVEQVLIESFSVRELAGKSERFEYALALRQYIAPPAPETGQIEVDEQAREEGRQEAAQQVEQIAQSAGELRVEVALSGDNQDYTNVIVLVEGLSEAGERITFTIEEQVDGVYRRENVPGGEYTVRAVRR